MTAVAAGGRPGSRPRARQHHDEHTVETSPTGTTAAASPLRFKPALRGLVVTEPRKLRTVRYAGYASMKLRWDAHRDPARRLRLLRHRQSARQPPPRSGSGCGSWPASTHRNGSRRTPAAASGSRRTPPTAAVAARRASGEGRTTRTTASLMRAVARRYEHDWQVVEIPNSQCTTIYAEPFILGADDASVDRLWRAGYTKHRHARCLRRSTRQLMRPVPEDARVARRSLQVAVHRRRCRSGIVESRTDAAQQARRQVRQALGARGPRPRSRRPGVPDPRAAAADRRQLVLLHGGPAQVTRAYGWQFTLNGGAMTDAADAGVAMGACFLEYAAFDALSPTKRRRVHDALRANCRD